MVGDGFGIPLIVRYLLETCERTEEAERVLTRVPSHMAYNVTVLDRFGHHVTAYVAPDRTTTLSRDRVTTNHQPGLELSAHALATASPQRLGVLKAHLQVPEESSERFVQSFREAPIHQPIGESGWGTLYSAVYDPEAMSVEYRLPATSWTQAVDRFEEGEREILYPTATV